MRRLPGTGALATFEAAARHRNFSRAAEEVGLTPAAVSYQVKEFERQLGFGLFVRAGRSMELTPAGRSIFDGVGEAFATLDRATATAGRLARGSAQLRLSLGARFAAGWLLPRLPGFRQAFPGIDLTFDITDQVRDFGVDDIDVAIRFGAGSYDGLRSTRLFETVIAAVCSPRLRDEARLDAPRDLLRQTLCHVARTTEGVAWPDWRSWMAEAGIDGFDDRACVAFDDTTHVVQAALAGSAVGLVDLAMIESDLAAGRLVRLFDIGLPVADAHSYHIVHPQRLNDDPRVVAWRAWMLAEAGAVQSRSDAVD